MNHELISEYDDILLGKRNNYSAYYFGSSKHQNEKEALYIFKYAFEYYLRWDPFTLRDMLNMEILKKLKLNQILKYIDFPPELNPETDLFYIVWKLYSFTKNYSERDLILRVYNNMLEDKIKKFPKEFFNGSYGQLRALVCLQYVFSNYMSFTSISEIYDLSATDEFICILKKYKLLSVAKDIFATPVDFAHYAIPKSQRDNTTYMIKKFEYLWEKYK